MTHASPSRTCKDCGGNVEWWETLPYLHRSCLQRRRAALNDYPPHVRPGVRVMDSRKLRAGRVIRIDDGCHWNCREEDDRWRPRAAYVLYDGDTPGHREWGPPVFYLAPDDIEVVPEAWGDGGTIDVRRIGRRMPERPFSAAVARPDGGSIWLLDERTLVQGWGAFGFKHATWTDLFDTWAVVVGERGSDAWGVYLRMEVEAPC